MKNLLLMVIALTLVFMVSENTFAQEYEPSADEVGVFTEPNFQGECRKYNTGYSPRPFYKKMEQFNFFDKSRGKREDLDMSSYRF